MITGSARDIVEECGVPRFVFTDFPLGNPIGKPYDEPMQRSIVGYGLDLLETAISPRTTVQTPFTWDEAGEWRGNFMRIDESNAEALRRSGKIRRAQQAKRKAEGQTRNG